MSSQQEEQQQEQIQQVVIETQLNAAYSEITNKYKRNNPSQTNLTIQRTESEQTAQAAEATESNEKSEAVNQEISETEAKNLTEIEKEILFLKEIVMKLRENYEKAVFENQQLKQNLENNLEENEEFVALRDNHTKSAARVEELEALLIVEKLNNIVAASNEKVEEIKNSEKTIGEGSRVAAAAANMQAAEGQAAEAEQEEEVLLVACAAAPRNPEANEASLEPKDAGTAFDIQNIEISIVQNDLRLVKAELEEQTEQNKKLRNRLERQALGKPSQEAEDKINSLEKAFEEQIAKAAELAFLLEAERARVSELVSKVEAFEAEKLQIAEEPVLVACAAPKENAETQANHIADLERQVQEQLLANQKHVDEKALLEKQLEESKKTQLQQQVTSNASASVPSSYAYANYFATNANPSVTVQEVKVGAQAPIISSYSNANASGNYNSYNNYVSSYTAQPIKTTYAADYSNSSSNNYVASASANNYGYPNYYSSQPNTSATITATTAKAASSTSIPLVSSSNTNVYKGPITYSNSIKSNSTSSKNNNNVYSSGTNYYNGNYSSYTGASSANGDLLLSASANPDASASAANNKTNIYSTNYSAGSSNTYPSSSSYVSYASGGSQVTKVNEEFGKRITQETDDIVARVLKESNITFGINNTNNINNASNNSYRSQQTQYISAPTLVSAAAPNKSMYSSTYYTSADKSNVTENIVKNKSVYETLNTN